MQVEISKIKPSPFQPRLEFDLEELKTEIQKDGLLSSLIVRKRDNYYELLDGERRLRVLKELGWKTVPVDIRDVKDRTIVRRSVFKLNKIRDNYTTEEEGRYYKKLADEEDMTFYEIGQELNVDSQWVLANLNVFKFPEEIQKAVWKGKYVTVSHIRELETTIARDIQEAVARATETIKEKLTRDELRQKVRKRQEQVDEKLRAKAIEETLPEIDPKSIEIKTPEDYEKAAEALKKEAKRKREAAMTEEEKAATEADKNKKAEESKQRREEEKRKKEEEIQKEAEKIAGEKLLKDEKFREEVKSDLSRSDVEGIKAIENDSILTQYDKKTLIGLIRKGEIRGKQQIDKWHETYRMHRTKVPKPRPEQEMKRRAIEEHLLDIAKGGEHLANLIMMLAGQVSSYPETLELFPPKETMKANSAMADLRRAIRDYHEKCEMAKSKLRKKGVLKEV